MIIIGLEIGSAITVSEINLVLSHFKTLDFEHNTDHSIIYCVLEDFKINVTVKMDVTEVDIFVGDYPGVKWDVGMRVMFRIFSNSELEGIKLFLLKLMRFSPSPFILSFDYAVTYVYRDFGSSLLTANLNTPKWLL